MTSQLEIDPLVAKMAAELRAMMEYGRLRDPVMIGIHTGGVWIARQLHQMLELPEPLGSLDISFYRDDFTRVGMNPQVRPSHLPFNIDDRQVILVDDVLYTGRTIRAALNEIFDYGRPSAVVLATLVDRGGRELPIQADIVGAHMELAPDQHIKLTGPENMHLALTESP